LISFAGIPKKTVIEVKKASNADIRRVISEMIPLANRQMADKSNFFKGKTEKETCENIWRYLKYKINYQADGSEQVIKAPSALVRYGSGDCKSYAVFTSAILTNLGIPHSLTYASYSQDPTPQHVYVTTASGIIIDAVWTGFNKEKKPTFKYNQKMNVKGITGTNVLMGSIGDTEKRPTVHAVALTGLAIPRNAFLGLVRLNIAGIASVLNLRLAQAWDLHKKAGKTGTPQFVSELFNKWYNIGGNPDALQNAITAGEAKKIAGIKLIDILRKKDPSRTGRYFTLLAQTIEFYKTRRGIDLRAKASIRGIGEATTAAAATAVAAVPVWVQVLSILAPVAITAMGGSQQGQLEEMLDDGSVSTSDLNKDKNQSSTSLMKYAGIAVAVGAAAYFLTRKKK
jgi:hypothetical protein